MKKFGLVAFLALFLVPAAASAQVTTSQYGDVEVVNGPNSTPVFQLTSDTSPGEIGYGGIYFSFNPGFAANTLTQLSTDYQMVQGAFGGGSPRFTLLDDMGGAAYVYFGTPNGNGTFSDPLNGAYGSTGNYANVLSGDARVESNGFGGYSSGYPPITFAQFLAGAGSTNIRFLTLDVDGGFTGTQQLLAANFNVNGNILSPTIRAAVPEPATWAMMLIGFGAVGASMRRRRRVLSLANA